MWVLLLSELIASTLSVLMQGNPLVMVGDRLAGINKGLLGWNFLGITLSITAPFTAFLYLTRKSVWRTMLLLAALGSSLWMMVLTASRGGFVGLILSLALTWWLLLRKSGRGRLAVALALASLVLASTKAPVVFWQRLATVWSSSDQALGDTSESAEESTEGRLYLVRQSLVVTIENPVFGLGVNNFPYYTGAKLKGDNAWLGTHNTYTQLSSEAGIPAFTLFVLLLWTMLRHALAVARSTKSSQNQDVHYLACALVVSSLVLCFQGFFAHLGYECLYYYVAAIVAALGNIAHGLKGADGSTSEVQNLVGATISS
jgi:O-antigen ligase